MRNFLKELQKLKRKVYNLLSYIITYLVIDTKTFVEPLLGENDFARIIIRKTRGKPTGLVIVCFTYAKGRKVQVVRVDCAHGRLHWDLLYEPKKAGRKEIIHAEISGKLIYDIRRKLRGEWREMKEKFFRNQERIQDGKEKP